MKYIKSFSLILGIALLFAACSKDDDNNNTGNNLNTTDQNFMVMATYSNLAEIDAGQLAATKAMDDSVKMFGQMMISDHTLAKNKLDSVNTQFNVVLPTTPDSAHQAIKAHLMTLSGSVFDTSYMRTQVIDHQNTVALFQTEIANGSNESVRNFATMNLPVIQMHLEMADSILARLQ